MRHLRAHPPGGQLYLHTGITVAAVALLALLPGAHAAKPQRRLKVGTVINGEQMATNSKDFRTTLHSRRLQDNTAIRSSIAFYITELAADLDAAGIDHTTVSADAGGMPDGPTTDFITAKRPLKLAFFNRLDSSRSATQQAYIMEKLLPATGAMLARSMRVRTPSGPLVFDGIPDEEGVFLPSPSGGAPPACTPWRSAVHAACARCIGIPCRACASCVPWERDVNTSSPVDPCPSAPAAAEQALKELHASHVRRETRHPPIRRPPFESAALR